MSYPPVIQFETRALEADAQASLRRERRTGRANAAQRLTAWLQRGSNRGASAQPPCFVCETTR